MKKTLCLIAFSFFTISYGYSQTSRSHHSSSSSTSRPSYNTPKHSESHGGTYTGPSAGSSHKGDHYTAPNGYKGYGTHKRK